MKGGYLVCCCCDVCGEKDEKDCNGGLSTGDRMVSGKQEMKMIDLMVIVLDRWRLVI